MKTLVELMEERQKHADELSEIKLKKASIEEKLKSATIGEEELAQLKSDAEELVSKAEELKITISKLDVEIKEKEDNLNKAAKSIKEVQKGKTQMEYLKTKEAALDFARILMDNEGSSNSARKAWEANLVEKGVTDVNKILPEPVLIAIQNAFNDYDGILNHVTKDPRYAVRVALQTQQAKAKGHQNGKTKKDESFVFIDYTINSAAVYIKYSFEYADLKKDTTGAYFNYVMNELAQGFIRAVERAVVIGDGKNSDDDDKITEIKSIAEETLAQLFDTQEISVDGEFDSTVLENLVKGIDKLAANTTPILVTSKTIARKLKMVKDGEKRYIDPQPFAPISQTGNVIAG